MSPRALGGALLVTGAVLAVVVPLVRHETQRPPPEVPFLPSSPEPAFTVAEPRPLDEAAPAARWSAVVERVDVRSEPSVAAPVEATLETLTPEGTQNLVLVHGRAVDDDGGLWIRIDGPGLPGEAAGWVPRTSLGRYQAVHTRLVVDLDGLTATLTRGHRVLVRFPVGIGTEESPTPRGKFYVRSRLTRYANAFYGPLAFGTSVRSPFVTDWPDGGFVGIHGTNQPELLPGRVSHGCIRLRNDDILRLGELMPVGTPITIR
jgi:lipoprotein-anchoring transpeptidase ErfK/SrfK